MKKRLLSLLCALALLLGALPSAAALEGESRRAAETLTALHVLPDSSKGLDQPITREEAATLLIRFSGSNAAGSAALSAVKTRGLLSRTVPQDGEISAEEFCAALLRLLGYLSADAPEAGAAVYARRIGLTAQDYEGALTRGEALQILRDALTFPDEEGVTSAERLVEAGLCTRAEAEAEGLFAQELTARQIVDRHMSAVFRLDTYYSEDHYQKGRIDNGGSGFFVSRDGLAVTNYHTIQNVVEATVTLITGETYRVERVVFCDPGADLALLRISNISTDKVPTPFFSYLKIAEEPELRPGDRVYTLGAPLGISLTVSEGIISAVNHQTNHFTTPCVINTADISPGSSGGALLNVFGHAAGITTAAYTGGNNLYLSVPLTPILEADWTAPGLPLSSVAAVMEAAG